MDLTGRPDDRAEQVPRSIYQSDEISSNSVGYNLLWAELSDNRSLPFSDASRLRNFVVIGCYLLQPHGREVFAAPSGDPSRALRNGQGTRLPTLRSKLPKTFMSQHKAELLIRGENV